MVSDDDKYSHDFAFGGFGKTRKASGGIKSQTKRGKAVATTWWGRRWLAVLDSFGIGERLKRGKAYARKGQVLNIEVSAGIVNARVQGSSYSPYVVEISIAVLSSADWQKLIEIFASRALYCAKLLSRQMPEQIEDVFNQLRLSLFPATRADLKTSCSCPDWSNPCKHIAAVYYLLAEEFDRDPFLIFALRGLDEDQLMVALDVHLSGVQPAESAVADRSAVEGKQPARTARVPVGAPADFWRCGSLPSDLTGSLRLPERSAALPRTLGNFPFWRGQDDFWSSLEGTYTESSSRILKKLIAFSGEST